VAAVVVIEATEGQVTEAVEVEKIWVPPVAELEQEIVGVRATAIKAVAVVAQEAVVVLVLAVVRVKEATVVPALLIQLPVLL
jgi:hypothetical protein